MNISNAITLDEVLSSVRDNEIEVAHLADDLRVGKGRLEAAKLTSYVNVFAFIGSNCGTDLKNFRKFWTTALAGSFKAGLQSKGVTPACAKRLSENSTGAFKANADLRKAATEGAAEVSRWFAENKITTERAIKALSGKTAAEPDEVLARKLADMDQERFSKVVERVRALKEIDARKANGPNGKAQPKAIPEVIAAES